MCDFAGVGSGWGEQLSEEDHLNAMLILSLFSSLLLFFSRIIYKEDF